MNNQPPETADSIRLDKWLWFARLAKTRSLAQRLIENGDVSVNYRIVEKPSLTVRPGDEVTLPLGRVMGRVRIRALGQRRGPPVEARELYEPVT